MGPRGGDDPAAAAARRATEDGAADAAEGGAEGEGDAEGVGDKLADAIREAEAPTPRVRGPAWDPASADAAVKLSLDPSAPRPWGQDVAFTLPVARARAATELIVRRESKRTKKAQTAVKRGASPSWWRAAERLDRRARAHGEVVASRPYRDGCVEWWVIGKRLGWVYLSDARTLDCYLLKEGEDETRPVRHARPDSPIRVGVYSLGAVHWGGQRCAVATAPGCVSVFLARNGHLWRFPGVRLDRPSPYIREYPETEQRKYAYAVARAWAEAVTPLPLRRLTNEAVTRYHSLVRGHVRTRILDCAQAGEVRTERDFARFVDATWGAYDLMTPRHPTLLHALQVGLVLALDSAQARYLVYFAALCEYRLPIVSEETAGRIYQEAVRLLATLSPSWWARAHLWDWSLGGSLETVLRDQWCRMVNAAFQMGVGVDGIVGAAPPPVDAVLDLRAHMPAGEPPTAPGAGESWETRPLSQDGEPEVEQEEEEEEEEDDRDGGDAADAGQMADGE